MSLSFLASAGLIAAFFVLSPAVDMLRKISMDYDEMAKVSVYVRAEDPAQSIEAAGIYGVDCSKGALEQLYGIEIDYYFRVNFSGFESIIDSIGGIDVDSDYDFTVDNWHYQVGTNHLDGLSALAFARERYTLPGGDLARGENQMKIIQATLNKCMSPAILSHYTEVLDSMEGSVQTNLPYSHIAALVRMQLNDGREWNIQSYGVSGTSSFSGTYSIPNQSLYVMMPDMETVEEAQRRMRQVVNDEFWEEKE